MSTCREAGEKARVNPRTQRRLITFPLFCCLVIFLFSTSCLEGQSSNSTGSGTGGQAKDQSQTPTPNQQTKQKKRDKGAADNAGAATSFSDAVAEDVLHVLMDGLQGHNEARMLSVFDPDAMDAFLNFSNQVSAMFQQYDSFRVHYNIDQATTDGTKGVVLVDFEMEKISGSGILQPVYKHEQIRFEMEHSKKGWKIVDVKPRTFFS